MSYYHHVVGVRVDMLVLRGCVGVERVCWC